MKEAIKKWWLNIKPIKYITLKQKYNQLDTKYQALLEAVKEECFEAIYSQINIPEQIQRKDKEIKRLKNQVKTLKDTIKLLNEDK